MNESLKLGRRSLLLGAAGLSLARAEDVRADDLLELPISLAVASLDGADVVDQAFIDQEQARASDLYLGAGITFDFARTTQLDSSLARLETRKDRDSLATLVVPHEVTVFIVASLRDVDDRRLYRMGVTWQKLSDTTRRYIIVAQSAMATTMAHELGHFFGLDHTLEKGNLMSYDRDDAHSSLGDAQLRKIRRTAQGLVASKSLVPREN